VPPVGRERQRGGSPFAKENDAAHDVPAVPGIRLRVRRDHAIAPNRRSHCRRQHDAARRGGANQAGGAGQAKTCAAQASGQARPTPGRQAGAAAEADAARRHHGVRAHLRHHVARERPAAEDRRDGAGALHRHAHRRHQVRQLAGTQGADRVSAGPRRGDQGLGRGHRAAGDRRQRGAGRPAAAGLRREIAPDNSV
jgi:hypothetical protein